jgi:dihydrofolate synthase/folylpolyglutamate synthase
MCDDKDCAGFMREIAPVVGKVWTVPLSTPRGIPAPALASHVRSAGISRVEPAASIAEAIEAAKADAAEAGRPVVIAGSLYLAGEVLAAAQNREPDPGELLRSDSVTT